MKLVFMNMNMKNLEWQSKCGWVQPKRNARITELKK